MNFIKRQQLKLERFQAERFADADKKKRYSYIKKPYAKSGWYSLGIGVLVVLLTALVFLGSVRSKGDSGFTAAALGISALLFSCMGLWFTRLSFREENKNYLFAAIGGVLSGLSLLTWILTAAMGSR